MSITPRSFVLNPMLIAVAAIVALILAFTWRTVSERSSSETTTPCSPAHVAATAATAAPAAPKAEEAPEVAPPTEAEVGPKATPPSEPPISIDGLKLYATARVAVVDGEAITANDFNKAAKQVSGRVSTLPQRLLKDASEQIVKRLIDRHLTERALESSGVTVTEAELLNEIKRLQTEYAEKNASLETVIGPDYADEIRRGIALRRHLRDAYGAVVTEEEARQHYRENRKLYRRPEQVEASHILIKLDRSADEEAVEKAKARALEISRLARDPDAIFGGLAREYSEGPTAYRGGALGFFDHKKMVPEFADAAFALEPGEVSEPVRSQFGYHVIKVFDRRPETTLSFESQREQITRKLEAQKLESAMKELVADLRADVHIRTFPENIHLP